MNVIQRLSMWFLVAMLLLAGISPLEFDLGAAIFPGMLWMVIFPVGLYLLVLNFLALQGSRPAFPCWPWIVWCAFVWVSLLWGDELGQVNVREAMKLTMPVMLAMLAGIVVHTERDLQKLFAAMSVSLVFLFAFAVAYSVQAFDPEWMELLVRESALSATLIGSAFLALFPRRKTLALAGWGTALLVATLTSSRMAALSLLVILFVHPYSWGRWYRKIAVASVFAAVGLIIFNTQSFQEHFFKSGQGTVGDVASGEFQGLGRFEVWPQVWDVAWERPYVGFGVGSIHAIVPVLWKNMISIHNDYLRVFYELGIFGFALTALVCGWQLLALRRQIQNRDDDMVRTAITAGWLGFWAMLVSCATDNTMAYVMYVCPLFILIGAAYGAARSEKRVPAASALKERASTAPGRIAPWRRAAQSH